ncbi:Acetolactate synthase chloroplastic [Euphorbia peplus]|nr:Acetolactate synthase chloroplastic [Euphorbia peplus]
MAAATTTTTFPKLSASFRYSSIVISKSPTNPKKFNISRRRSLCISNTVSIPQLITTSPARFSSVEPQKGADILVEALEREGVNTVFAYPGGASVEIHQALSRSSVIRNILPRHEQGGIFAAEGYARACGKPGVCIVTSGPGVTNIISGLADALLDSVPLVVITGQVPRSKIGTDAFQETATIEITRPITKHNYIIVNIEDIPRIVREAFFIASSGRPGPVLIDIPKDIQQQLTIPNWSTPIQLDAYISRLPNRPSQAVLHEIVRLISHSRKPVLYIGGGCLSSSEELRKFVGLTGIPVASTLMGLGVYPLDNELSLQMLGIHGNKSANYAVEKSDLLLALGVRFDDRVTGKVEAFASRATIVHIDIDSAEIGKNKMPHLSLCADVKLALQELNKIISKTDLKLNLGEWRKELNVQKLKIPNPNSLQSNYYSENESISPENAIKTLDELTKGNAIITSGVGQHQMWAAQFYKFKRPRHWLTSGGFGAMGFGLPAAIGASLANPSAIVVDIDGDGSFMMNIQELATIKVENLPIKIMILNNQHLGMVLQWEDQFCNGNRAGSFLGDSNAHIFPDMLKFAQACGIPAARVTKTKDVKEAIQMMLDTRGPYLLDVIVPHQYHVCPPLPIR